MVSTVTDVEDPAQRSQKYLNCDLSAPLEPPNPPADAPMSPVAADDPDLGGDINVDDDVEELTRNLSQLLIEERDLGPVLERRNVAGRAALWDVPDDLEMSGAALSEDDSDDEEDAEIQREWLLQEDADEYELFGERSELTADEILTGQFISETVRNAQLSALDRAICRSYAWKMRGRVTDHAFDMMRFAYPQTFGNEEGLPNLGAHKSRIAFLSELEPERYHCCLNSCICYVGPYENYTECPFCHESRLRPDGQPRKIFTYLPITPRLRGFFRNPKLIKLLRYRADYQSDPDEIRDVFDSELYRDLCEKEIEVEQPGKKMPRYFADWRDIALGASTDGFAPFKRRKQTAWPIIVFLYNLPPEIRFHLEFILSLGVIPGPNKPKDMCSFLYPFVLELWKLANGITTFDISSDTQFKLHAFLILVFGDIPAVSMLMRMKGHNGYSPCRMCKIIGVPVPNSNGKTLYVPLDRSTHPDVINKPASVVRVYDPKNLPLRTHTEFRDQALEVDGARTNKRSEELAREYGIKGLPIFFHVKSLQFPRSFPYDFMHLIWENLGSEDYTIDKAIWEAIGKDTAAASSTIPSAFGARVPNLAKGGSQVSAEMYSIWTQFIGPTRLRHVFKDIKYYDHFILLVQIINICLQFSITRDYERFYYQYNPSRLPICMLTVHGLLHIPDSIEFAGPQWCYWAYPMERYCGALQPGIRSRRFPYASLDRWVLETAQLAQIGVLYDVTSELKLRSPPNANPQGSCRVPGYDAALLLGPTNIAPEIPTKVLGALATRFNLGNQRNILTKQILKHATCIEWSKIRRVDSEAGDTMVAADSPSSALANQQDLRDRTFVWYEAYVDKHTHQRNREPVLEPRTFYGQLQKIYLVNLQNTEVIQIRKPKLTIPIDYHILLGMHE
ncbi:hypothetical protein MSAN_02480700 [Mycena sanguinolenta]|uniref:Transposase family Tnp2 protein n=1 Tax=Mycena sanguinolenta TaxID=230812 RepID=A0A8H6U288_9AGAR|nr:hypothetical protein MSAN_02480700 [Mycena sanguinolenta]